MQQHSQRQLRERWLPVLADTLVSLIILSLALSPLILLMTPKVPLGRDAIVDFLWSAGPAMLVLAGTFVYVRALLRERRRIESRLEDVVEERTRELQAINQELRDEIFVREQAERSFRRSSRHFRALFDTAATPIILIDSSFRIRQWNASAESLFGYSRDEAVGRNLVETFIPEEYRDEMGWKILKTLGAGHDRETLETGIRGFDGSHHIILWNLNLLQDEEEDRHQLILIGQNISEIRRTQDQLHYLAHFDALTGLANRRLFEDRCRRALASATRHGHHCALISLDVDHFKRINDTLGHDAGDVLLQTLSQRLKDSVREEDTIARLGGDEFAVLLHHVSGAEGCEKVARSILDDITRPITVPGGELVITSSIGITVAPVDGASYEQLLKNADMAMYRAKKAGRNNVQFFSEDMNQEIQRQMSLEQELRAGIRAGELDLHYQPVLDARSGRIVAMESLLRWNHPRRGLLRPGDFLEVAEQSGQLHAIGEWICNNACLQARAIQAMSGDRVQISINLSSRQYNHPKLGEELARTIELTRLDPSLLMVEIDERLLSDRLEETSAVLHSLKETGIGLTLDRFGSGLSSLTLLRELPFDQVKIDPPLLQRAPDDENTAAITHTLISLARQLSLRVAAAGVETEEQHRFLRQAGCHLLQGHRFCPPVSSDGLGELFAQVRQGRNLLPDVLDNDIRNR
ncbi:PAS domain S-box-containing protein/diguanylate cyclase (GGDEF) domain-containing protein [Marinobacter daqiaonensis]|uniref:PAS domain S-box-containing protein/diguanylate cyclase (GGDEF) domain-containing protein n=1 Tax=Marinobacter daqiaonensis TaxID=650891 RepID=A0A1I6GGC1_9GAMM|nr:EAL domain-containing protein [Marinobacter daqiaonensis]SFR41180.1 PAS domain S-box-containing protein/diguanylate cyclase (GGDEF) domain-containing protein [Marinobacter daqiaonensis]